MRWSTPFDRGSREAPTDFEVLETLLAMPGLRRYPAEAEVDDTIRVKTGDITATASKDT